MIHEDPPHDASRDGEEMRPVLPLDVFRFNQPEIRLVDEKGCLSAVTRALSGHAALCDRVEFAMDERNQPLEGTHVAPPPLKKEPGDSRGVRRNGPILRLFRPYQVFAVELRL